MEIILKAGGGVCFSAMGSICFSNVKGLLDVLVPWQAPPISMGSPGRGGLSGSAHILGLFMGELVGA